MLRNGIYTMVLVFSLMSLTNASKAEAAPYIWGEQDVEKTLNALKEKGEGPLLDMPKTVFFKHPFYSGPLPLIYRSTGISVFGGTRMAPLWHKFADWETMFLYFTTNSFLSCLPDGAVTIDPKTRRIIAEAKTLNIIKGTGVQIEEYHYGDDDKLIFQCSSIFSFGNNFKTTEKVKQGQKIKDYYFIFPVTGY